MMTHAMTNLRRAAAWAGVGAALAAGLMLAAGAEAAQEKGTPQGRPGRDGLDRTVLPIREPKYPPITELDARKAKAPPRFEIKAPKGAPNVVIVLIDDMGFGQPSTFGGAIAMPTLDRRAQNGLPYNQVHPMVMC